MGVEPAVGPSLPDDLKAQLEAELEGLARLAETEGVAPDHLGFCERVARSHAAARAAIRARGRADQPMTGTTAATARRLPPGAVAFDLEALRDLLRALSSGVGAAPSAHNYLDILTHAAAREPELLRHLAAAVLPDDDIRSIHVLAERLGIPAAALHLVGRLLAAPFVAEARYQRGWPAEVDARDIGTAEAGRCPTCASPPVLAVLSRDAGRRHLSCGLCDDTWLAPRLMCAACGTRDQSRLGMLSVREPDARWIETCDACGGYLRTVDQRRLPEDYRIVPRAEDAAFLYLDFMAENAGYLRLDCYPSLLVRDPT
jgi:formate dehydrogenase accessory protein FdhE